MKLLALAVVLAARAASADTELSAQLSAGAATDTTAPAGEATVHGEAAGGVVGRPASVARHCLLVADDTSYVAFLSSDDPSDRDAVRADASITELATANAHATILTAGGSARGCGWQLGLHVADQPVGSLRDTYWRSGRGVIATTTHVEIPPDFSVGTATSRFAMGGIAFDVVDRHQLGRYVGYDVDGQFRFIRWTGVQTTVDMFDVFDVEYDGPAHGDGTGDSFTQTVANDIGADVLAIDWRSSDGFEVTVRGGLEQLTPLATYTQEGTTGTTSGPKVAAPRYWAELAQHRADHTLAFGAGSWARLDPTGGAADLGELATARGDWRLGHLELHANLEAGRLRRALVSPMAAPTLAPAGTAMVMGRGTLEADYALPHHVVVAGSSWLERSDRDDPRWIVPADGSLATHAGADLDVRLTLR